MSHPVVDLLRRIEELLHVERHLIREGSFDQLAKLAVTKESLMQELGAHEKNAELTHAPLARIRVMAERNQSLINAALKGIRAAQKRLEMIQRASSSMNSYDRLGKTRAIGSAFPSVERRA